MSLELNETELVILLNYETKIGNLAKIKEYYSLGAKISEFAIKIAAINGHLDILKYFVTIGVDLSLYDNYPLRTASTVGHFNIVKFLIENVNVNIKACNNEAIREASARGHLEIVIYLHKNGADITRSAIEYASFNRHLNVLEYLKNGVYIYVKQKGEPIYENHGIASCSSHEPIENDFIKQLAFNEFIKNY